VKSGNKSSRQVLCQKYWS